MERGHAAEAEAVTKLQEAAMKGNLVLLIESLREHPLLLDEISMDDYASQTPLHIAAMRGYMDIVQVILNRNKELALKLDSRGRSPLHLAVAKGHTDIVKMLLNIDPPRICKLIDKSGKTPLHVAATKGHDALIQELIGANPDATHALTHQQETILHLAVKHDHLDTVKLLLSHVDRVEELLKANDSGGNTILHVAVEQKHFQIVKYLVGGEVGVEINAVNRNGCTPLDMQMQSLSASMDMEIGELLRDNGAERGIRRDIQSKIPSKEATSVRTRRVENNQVSESEKWVTGMPDALLVVASLIVTASFQAMLSPSGGVFQEDGDVTRKGKRLEYFSGYSIMAFNNPEQYKLYIMFNTMAFAFALSILCCLTSAAHILKRGSRVYAVFLVIILWLALLSMCCAYYVAAYATTFVPSSSDYEVPVPAPGQTIDNEDANFAHSAIRQSIKIATGTWYGFGFGLPFIVWLVRKCIRVKNQRLPLTSATMEGNV